MSLHISREDNFEDRDGNRRTFTNVDWSRKTQVSTQEIDIEQVKKELKEYKADILKDILEISPAFAGQEYIGFVLRGEERTKLEWDAALLSDEGIQIDELVRMRTILTNRQELYQKII